MNNKKLNIFEAFAGIGSQKRAAEISKLNHKIIGMAEWFVPAIISYEAIHHGLSSEKIINDITPIEKKIKFLESLPLSMDSKSLIKKGAWKRKNKHLINISYFAVKASHKRGNIFDIHRLSSFNKRIDLLTYSFPCQDLSQQGKQKGIKPDTRSGLLFQIEKYLETTKHLPKYLIMENVMPLSYKNHSKDFDRWKRKLERLKYSNDVHILNSADFGSPQARKRVFMISTRKISNPLIFEKLDEKKIADILDKKFNERDELHLLSSYKKEEPRITRLGMKKTRLIGYTNFNSEASVYYPNHKGPTLTASGANSRIKIIWGEKIRKMNAREAYKYMGFTEDDYNSVNNLDVLSPVKMIYTCGNSISIEVMTMIMKGIKHGK